MQTNNVESTVYGWWEHSLLWAVIIFSENYKRLTDGALSSETIGYYLHPVNNNSSVSAMWRSTVLFFGWKEFGLFTKNGFESNWQLRIDWILVSDESAYIANHHLRNEFNEPMKAKQCLTKIYVQATNRCLIHNHMIDVRKLLIRTAVEFVSRLHHWPIYNEYSCSFVTILTIRN